MRRLYGAALLGAALCLAPSGAEASGPGISFDISGYYRAESILYLNLFDPEQPTSGALDFTGLGYPHPERTSYMLMRGRFIPKLTFLDQLTLTAEFDVFDSVLWGDNENIAATPLFAGEPSNTQVDGAVIDPLSVNRLWLEWRSPVGIFRIGRQPSNWGLGLLANGGDGNEDDDFGVNRRGTTMDRIIFLTRPITVAKGIAAAISGRPRPSAEDDPGFIFGIGYDRLVESSAIPYDQNFNDNIPDENDPQSGYRWSPIWLSDGSDNVHEIVLVGVFRREGLQVRDLPMDITAGIYAVHRWQAETASRVWILDGYLDWSFAGAFVQAELYHILGTTQAIGADGDAPEEDDIKTPAITGWVARAGYERDFLKVTLEWGYASGDDDPFDERFTGRALHSDYQVGLILYPQIIAQRTQESYAGVPETQGLWSRGGVYNSWYFFPRVTLRPSANVEFRIGYLTAMVDRVDGGIIGYLTPEERAEFVDQGGRVQSNRSLGHEIDGGIHLFTAERHLEIALEAGVLIGSPRLALARDVVGTFQGRFVFSF